MRCEVNIINKKMKTAKLNLREWQKCPRLLIVYINILTHRHFLEKAECIPITTILWIARKTVIITYARVLTFCNSNNLLYQYKFVICIYQKYHYDISQLCITRWCLLYLSNVPRSHFNPNAFEVSITNTVWNIYRNANKFLPKTIIFLLDKDFYKVIYFP